VNDWCDEDMFLICATDIQTDMLITRLYTPTRVYYSAPDRGVEYCDERVCLSVIMSSELHVRFSPTFLCMLPMARVCLSVIMSSELHVRFSPTFFMHVTYGPWLGPPLTV